MVLRSGVNAPVALIEKYINSAYDNVKLVAENIDSVNQVAPFVFSYITSETEPTTRYDGSALVIGDRWYDANDSLSLYVWDGTDWVPLDSPYYDLRQETITATEGQSVFTLNTLNYTIGNNSLLIFRRGQKLILGADYTETNTTTFTLTFNANDGDVFECYTTLLTGVSGQVIPNIYSQRSRYTATGGEASLSTDFTYTPGTNSLYVFRNTGKLILGDDYTETTNSTITPLFTVNAGDEFEFISNMVSEDTIESHQVSYTPTGTDAVPTTVQNKLRESVSVFDFIDATQVSYIIANNTASQVPDLVTAGIQAAFNAGVFYFPAGTYAVSSLLTIANQAVNLRGDGVGKTIIKCSSSFVSFTSNDSNNYFLVSGMSVLQTTSASAGTPTTAFSADFSGQISGGVITKRTKPRGLFRDLDIRGVTDANVDGWYNHIVLISPIKIVCDNVKIAGQFTTQQYNIQSNYGIRASGSGSPVVVVIQNSDIYYCSSAVSTSDLEGLFISDSNLVANMDGVFVDNIGAEPQVQVSDTHISSFRNGIDLESAWQLNLHNNLIYGRQDSNIPMKGIYVRSQSQFGIISENIINASSMGVDTLITGVEYKIITVGTTDFTLLGAASNTAGLVFTATGVGTGTGVVAPMMDGIVIGDGVGLPITATYLSRNVFRQLRTAQIFAANSQVCYAFADNIYSNCTTKVTDAGTTNQIDTLVGDILSQYAATLRGNLSLGGADAVSRFIEIGTGRVGDANSYLDLVSSQALSVASVTIGVEYEIVVAGTTDFTLIGAADSNPGTIFTATAKGTGTGTVKLTSGNNDYSARLIRAAGANGDTTLSHRGIGDLVLDPADAGASVRLTKPLKSATYTVATLPTGVLGMRAFVTDANATTYASIVADGGANGVPVYHDGTNWRIG